jgi:hypothetical protein
MLGVFWVLCISNVLNLQASDPMLIGQWPGYSRGEAYHLTVADGKAFLTERWGGLTVLDVSSPNNPTHIGTCSTSGEAGSFLIVGDRAIVQSHVGNLDVIDISVPSNCKLLKTYPTAGDRLGMCNSSNRIYLAEGYLGLRITELGEAGTLTPLGRYSTGDFFNSVTVDRNIAYVATQTNGIQIIDVSTPSDPKLLGNYKTSGTVCKIVGDLAYLNNGLEIIDISHPAAPVSISKFDSYESTGIAVDGNIAVRSQGWEGIQIFDVSDSSKPILISSIPTFWASAEIALTNNLLYLAGNGSGLQIYDLSNPHAPAFTGVEQDSGMSVNVMVRNGVAYLSEFIGGLAIIDVKNPTRPFRLGGLKNFSVSDIDLSGDLGFAVDSYSGLKILNIKDPFNPSIIGEYPTGNLFLWAVASSGDVLYVGGPNSTLWVMDVSDPANPRKLQELEPNTGNVHDIDIVGEKMFTSGIQGMEIWDISDRYNPTSLCTFDLWKWCEKFQIAGNYAFVAELQSGTGALSIWDVSNPIDPVQLSRFETGGSPEDVAISGNLAFVACGLSGVQIVDISDPVHPVKIKQIETGYYARSVFAVGDTVYLADVGGGLQILNGSKLTDPALEISRAGLGPMSLRLTGAIGHEYDVQFSSKLQAEDWYSMQILTLTNTIQQVTDESFEDSKGFYRVRLVN